MKQNKYSLRLPVRILQITNLLMQFGGFLLVELRCISMYEKI